MRDTIREALLAALTYESDSIREASREIEGTVADASCSDPQVAGKALREIYSGRLFEPLRAALCEAERHCHDLCREHQAALAAAEIDARHRVLRRIA